MSLVYRHLTGQWTFSSRVGGRLSLAQTARPKDNTAGDGRPPRRPCPTEHQKTAVYWSKDRGLLPWRPWSLEAGANRRRVRLGRSGEECRRDKAILPLPSPSADGGQAENKLRRAAKGCANISPRAPRVPPPDTGERPLDSLLRGLVRGGACEAYSGALAQPFAAPRSLSTLPPFFRLLRTRFPYFLRIEQIPHRANSGSSTEGGGSPRRRWVVLREQPDNRPRAGRADLPKGRRRGSVGQKGGGFGRETGVLRLKPRKRRENAHKGTPRCAENKPRQSPLRPVST